MIMRSRRFALAAGVAGVIVVAAAVAVVGGAGHRPTRTAASRARPAPTVQVPSPPVGPASTSPIPVPVSADTTVPTQTPVQQRYDQAFEKGFSTPSNQAELSRIEAIRLPGPAISGGWPDLPASDTPGGWTRQFVSGLLDINFATQSRVALGAWLVAEEAPDLMPGVPPAARYGGLYATVLDPAITGQPSPIPSDAVWQADAAGGVRWTASDLLVGPDPQWQSMIDAGWQPTDLRGGVEDVSGVLAVTEGSTTTSHPFSAVLQVGSARWHDGYGSVLLAGWKES